jgi:hypothetical protein
VHPDVPHADADRWNRRPRVDVQRRHRVHGIRQARHVSECQPLRGVSAWMSNWVSVSYIWRGHCTPHGYASCQLGNIVQKSNSDMLNAKAVFAKDLHGLADSRYCSHAVLCPDCGPGTIGMGRHLNVQVDQTGRGRESADT